MNNHILLFSFLLASSAVWSQTKVDQNVISSAGNSNTTNTLIITSTVGEAVIQTIGDAPSSVVLTQGFQQTFEGTTMTFDVTVTSPLCNERNDGFAEVSNIVGCDANAKYLITWSNGNMGARATSLGVGSYTVQITDTVNKNCSELVSLNVEATNDLPCLLKFYSGITPNGDAINDSWIIDNIELFPSNEIKFYNRLGNKVWEGKNYNNLSVVWGGENLSGNDLPSDTYFYIFESGSNVEKGWVELTR
jgi:gliding motility-associated-like protein